MKVCRFIVVMAAFCCHLSVAATSLLVKISPLTKLGPMDCSAASVLLIRGGDPCIVSEPDESSNPLVLKIRNVVRSLLEIGERKSPTAVKFLRGLLERVESLLGIQLLPQLKLSKKANKKTSSKKKKTTNSKEATQSGTNDSDSSDEIPATKRVKNKSKTAATLKATSTAHAHTTKTISTTNPNYRIQRELKEFIKSPPPNLSVKVGSNMRIWIITMKGAANTIYDGETYKLRVQFPKDYPIVPPSVYFMAPPPQHEHVYTNGDICLSLLGKDWRPTMTAQSIAVSILSILSSAQSKSLPMDNARHSQNKPGQYQKDWIYHDDNC
jgi:ubiquitin-conjugating enzyme E2 W